MTMYRVTTNWKDEKNLVIEGYIRTGEYNGNPYAMISGLWVKARIPFLDGKPVFRSLQKYKKLTAYQEARERAAYNNRHTKLWEN